MRDEERRGRSAAREEEEEEEKGMAKEGQRTEDTARAEEEKEKGMAKEGERTDMREGGRAGSLKKGIRTRLLVGTAFVCGIRIRLLGEPRSYPPAK